MTHQFLRGTNEHGEELEFLHEDIGQFGFAGIVLIDCDEQLDLLHPKSLKKSLDHEFPIAIMKKEDFEDILPEIDTIPDLMIYLHDRYKFIKVLMENSSTIIRDYNIHLEKSLISFYKMNNNSFPLTVWNDEDYKKYVNDYEANYADRKQRRDLENEESHVIDQLIDEIRKNSTLEKPTLLYASELANTTRRQRAIWLSEKVVDAIDRMINGNSHRHFGYFNQATGNHYVFVFEYGSDRESFIETVNSLIRHKLVVEIKERDFEYSVFGYGFRKSSIDTGNTFDDVVLDVIDAAGIETISDEEYAEALKYFGKLHKKRIQEFPD